MRLLQTFLVLLCAGLLFSPTEVLAQRGGRGGGGRGGGGYRGGFGGGYRGAGGYRYASPSRSYYYAPRSFAAPSYRSALPTRSTISRPNAQPYLSGPRATVRPRAGAVGAAAAGRSFGGIRRGPTFNAAINRFNRPWYNYHRGWYYGAWNNWGWYPAFWAGLYGGSWLSPWAWGGSYAYVNPYWTYSAAGGDEGYVPDYSTPIPVPSESDLSSIDEKKLTDAMTHFAMARAYFKNGMYKEATDEDDQAIRLVPGDRTMHEFRALTLFARKMYGEAAGTIYAVLSAGPGWNWDTMAGLYKKTETYTRQLRDLEGYVRDHPKDAKAHFLLAYHYLVLDERQPAIAELRAAAQLNPQDKLSPQLADALSKAPAKEQ
jgi:hypothetical protein